MTLEEMSLLKTVFENPEPVLLARNLKSYFTKNTIRMNGRKETYLDEKMNIKVGTSCVFLVRVLNSTSFNENNTL